jgi:hypothetical protein
VTKITGWMRSDREGARGVTVAASRYVEVKLTTDGRVTVVTVWHDGRTAGSRG